jgi:transmembrane sensor
VALFQDKRTVALHRGEIMFAVAADTARPFLVDADLGHVRVTGTQFDVRRDSDLLTVAVQSGRVEVSSGRWWRLDTQTLTAGQATSLDRNGIVREATPVDVSAITAWRDGRVVFRNTPLVEVIREINRYLEQPIRLTDPRLQRQRVTASFLLDDPEALIKSLPRVLNLQVRQLADGTLLLVSS